jgi:trigger factor
MQVSVESTGNIQRKMTIEVPADRADLEVDKRLKEMRGKVRLDGFRPGKVPLSVVKKIHGNDVYREVAGGIIQASFYEAATQEEQRVVGLPNIETKTFQYGKDIEFTASFDIYPDIEIAALESHTVTRESAQVNDADIDKMIETLRSQQTTWIDVERAAQNGDSLTIDFNGLIEGESFDGGTAEGVKIELGSGRMLPDFETALIGMSIGEEKTTDVTFPDDYQAEKLQGKTAQFTQTVKAIQAANKPELDADFIKKFGIESGEVDALRETINENMQRELATAIQNKLKMQVMDTLANAHDFDIPTSLVTEEIKHVREEMQQEMQQGGATQQNLDLSTLPDDLFQEKAEKRVKLGLLVGEIIRQKDIKKDDAKVEAKLEELASTYEDPKALVDYYRGNQQAMQRIEAAVMEDLIVDWASAQMTVEEAESNFDSIMNRQSAAA